MKTLAKVSLFLLIAGFIVLQPKSSYAWWGINAGWHDGDERVNVSYNAPYRPRYYYHPRDYVVVERPYYYAPQPVWIRGHWQWTWRGYVWVPGHWQY